MNAVERGHGRAVRVAALGGSWTFITSFFALLLLWILCNAWVLARHSDAFDVYSCILLNLVLSLLAAEQAPGVPAMQLQAC